MTPHEQALEAIKKHLLPGPIQEIVPFAGHGFGELKDRDEIVWDEFLKSEPKHYPNRIIHLLHHNGVPPQKTIDVFRKASGESRRVLDLLRGPSTVFREYITKCGRNELLTTTHMPGWDATINGINRNSIKSDKPYVERPLPDKYDILMFSSEECPSPAIEDRIAESGSPIWCICGGFMFLNLLFDLPSKPITLVDTSCKQLLHAYHIIETIRACPAKEEFLTKVMSADEKQVEQWENLVMYGGWLKQYNHIRNKLDIRYHWGPINKAPIQKGDIAYCSTIPPDQWPKDCHIIEAYTKRDIPQWRNLE